MSIKSSRHQKIRELIREYDIETQEELAEHLKREGYVVTQATVSRDIRELQLSKLPGKGGRNRYGLPGQEGTLLGGRGGRVLREGFISMDLAQDLLVIRTAPGMAMAVAAALDDLKLPQLIGCIAGDDTIMAAVRSKSDAETVTVQLQEILDSL